MRNLALIGLFFIVFGGCVSDSEKASSYQSNIRWQKNQYAQLFKIGHLNGDTFLQVFQDANTCIGSFYWGKSTNRTGYSKIENTTRIVSLTTIFSRFIWAIHKQSSIIAVDNLKYHCAENFAPNQKIVSVNPQGTVNLEQILKLKANITFAYYISLQDKKQLERLNSKNHAVIFVQNHLEAHPLARAEWIRVFGAVLHKPQLADSIFSVVEQNYTSLKNKKQEGPAVMINLPYSGVWLVPSHNNLITTLIKDAGGKPVWLKSNSPKDGNSFQLGIEEAVSALKRSTVWLHAGICDSKACIRNVENRIPENELNRLHCYQNDRRIESNSANPYWDYGALRPDLLLNDLILLFQSKTEDAYFYREIK